jgi:hypothetical protein
MFNKYFSSWFDTKDNIKEDKKRNDYKEPLRLIMIGFLLIDLINLTVSIVLIFSHFSKSVNRSSFLKV